MIKACANGESGAAVVQEIVRVSHLFENHEFKLVRREYVAAD